MIEDVMAALAHKRFRYRTETDLHVAMSAAFDDAGIAHEREVKVVGGRIDFLIGSLGVEVKIKGGLDPLRRQVERYSKDERIGSLLVVSTRPAHRLARGTSANGKPIHAFIIGGFSL